MQVWTSLSTYPTTKKFVQTFFLEKVWLQNTLPTYSLDICPKFRSFFIWDSLLNKSFETKHIFLRKNSSEHEFKKKKGNIGPQLKL